MSDAEPALVLDRVTAGYGSGLVLRDFSLTVARRTVHALIGPNGAGKSTVTRVASGLLRHSGRVRVAGLPPGKARVGLAPQECALFPALTAQENVLALARLGGLARTDRSDAVAAALRRSGCESRAGQAVRTLSGGWRRRVNLAAALVGEPPLIIADEPTEGVDVGTRVRLGEALRDAAARGSGCLLISHDADFVASVADRVSVLLQGRVVGEGAPHDLLYEAFGRSRLVTVRMAQPAPQSLRVVLEQAGLTADAAGLEWLTVDDDALALATRLAPLVDAVGGEVSIRRPGLDQIVDRMTGALG